MMHGQTNIKCTYNRLPEDEPSGSEFEEDITKRKPLVYKRPILLVHISYLYCNCRPVYSV